MSVSQGLQGHLDLVCGLDDLGRSAITRQSFRAPVHLGKPWRDGKVLIVNVVNQTAGLLSGDRITTKVRVETGASLLLTTPSASRAHPTPSGQIRLEQSFLVAAQGNLEIFPEMFIPHRDTDCSQRTVVQLDVGASLLAIEVLAPGRVAMGESFAYRLLDWRLDVFLGDRPLIRERTKLDPTSPNLLALREKFPNAYYGTVSLVTPEPCSDIAPLLKLLDLQNAEFWIGVSRLTTGWSIKMLAADSLTMRRGICKVRRAVYEARGVAEPGLRKI